MLTDHTSRGDGVSSTIPCDGRRDRPRYRDDCLEQLRKIKAHAVPFSKTNRRPLAISRGHRFLRTGNADQDQRYLCGRL